MAHKTPEQKGMGSGAQGEQTPHRSGSKRSQRTGSIVCLIAAGAVAAVLPNSLGASPIAPTPAAAPKSPATTPYPVEKIFPPEPQQTEGQKYFLSPRRDAKIEFIYNRLSQVVLDDEVAHAGRTTFYDTDMRGHLDGHGVLEEVIAQGNHTFRFGVRAVRLDDGTFVLDTGDRALDVAVDWPLSDKPGDIHSEGVVFERWRTPPYPDDNPWSVGSGMAELNKGGGAISDVHTASDPSMTEGQLRANEARAVIEFWHLANEAGIH